MMTTFFSKLLFYHSTVTPVATQTYTSHNKYTNINFLEVYSLLLLL